VLSVSQAIRNRNISQGQLTKYLEDEISRLLGIDYVFLVTSGSMALVLALMACGIGKDDEVIIPDRTWIATAHAVLMLGAVPIIVDTKFDSPIIDEESVETVLTPKTKAIIPVHMNGRAANMDSIKSIANNNSLMVIEDAAQAFMSKFNEKFLGTIGDIGCFSLSMAKLISTGQGGFLATKCSSLASKIKKIRTHGLDTVYNPSTWGILGGNFRYTDLQASIGINQLKSLDRKISHCKLVYNTYKSSLSSLDNHFSLIDVDIKNGEIPIYNEYLCPCREELLKFLSFHNVNARPFYPSISQAPYLSAASTYNHTFSCSKRFSQNGIYLPSGTDIPLKSVHKVISLIKKFFQKEL